VLGLHHDGEATGPDGPIDSRLPSPVTDLASVTGAYPLDEIPLTPRSRGKAGVELAKVLYDTSPQIREVPPPRRKRTSGQYQLGVTELLQAAATNAAAAKPATKRLML